MSKVTMRCKVQVQRVDRGVGCDHVYANPVAKSGTYPADGHDEDNTFAKFSPGGEFKLDIANPNLLGVIEPGDKFYVDWTLIPKEQPKPKEALTEA
jgi:hypothetical protein